MEQGFQVFEQGIGRVAEAFPGLPRQQVILTRLYFFLFRRLNDGLNRMLADHGLNTTTMLALTMIYARPDHKIIPSDLSLALTSSRTNVTRLADELVANGWVERQACREDRRKIFLYLTALGCARVEKVLPRQWDHVTQVWSCLSPEEATLLESLLRKLLGHLE